MTAKAFLTVASILTIIFGLGMLLAPGECLTFLGTNADAGGDIAGRVAGAALIGLAVGFWYARDADLALMMSPATKGLLYGGCIFNVLGLIVTAWAATSGRMGSMGWVLAVIQLLLAIGFIYFAEGRRSMVRA